MPFTQETRRGAGRNRFYLPFLTVAITAVVIGLCCLLPAVHAGPIVEPLASSYKVLAPIASGNSSLLLLPVVRVGGTAPPAETFLTLDEGLRSGEVEITEAGRIAGLVRPRSNVAPARYRGDEVNTLVLINHSKRPLLLLAGEIVTGGKQDRIVAKDRIVPAGGDPVDLSVFCVEHGRWTESSANFGVTDKTEARSFMVQPAVRQEAMVAKDQQRVWDSVGGAVSTMEVAAAPSVAAGRAANLGTTSYAKAMRAAPVASKVDEAEASLLKDNTRILAQLEQEHAVGVVVAVRGEIIWADLFANTSLLTRYWPKLVRSYAAEGLAQDKGMIHGNALLVDAQRFLDEPMKGTTETSEGETDVYRNLEVKTARTDMFTLVSLLPGTGYDVHISKLRLQEKPHMVTKPMPDDRPVILY